MTCTLQIAVEGVYNLVRSCRESCWCDYSGIPVSINLGVQDLLPGHTKTGGGHDR